MPFLTKAKTLHWTFHAHAKMRFYRLSEQRVKSVIHSPRRVEEGVAPNTIAMMSPVSVKRIMKHEAGIGGGATRGEEVWNQEIWVMIEETKSKVKGSKSKVISAWRYPGMTKPRSGVVSNILRQEYKSYEKDIN